MNSSRLAWAVDRLREGPQSRLCARFVSLHCLPRAGRRRAATASAVIPRGERLDTRSCEKGLAPHRKLTRGLTALKPSHKHPRPTSHIYKKILNYPLDPLLLLSHPFNLWFHCYKNNAYNNFTGTNIIQVTQCKSKLYVCLRTCCLTIVPSKK